MLQAIFVLSYQALIVDNDELIKQTLLMKGINEVFSISLSLLYL